MLQIVAEDAHTLVVAEDRRFMGLVYLVGLAVYAALALACGLAAGSLAWAAGTGALLGALFVVIHDAHTDRWTFDRRAGTVTRTRLLLVLVPLRRRWPLSALRQVEVGERTNSDGCTARILILHLTWESVATRPLAMTGPKVQALAGKIRAAARAAAPLPLGADPERAPAAPPPGAALGLAHKMRILVHGPLGPWRAAWAGTPLAQGSDELRFRPDGSGRLDSWGGRRGAQTIEFAWRLVAPGRLRLCQRLPGEDPAAALAARADQCDDLAFEFRTLWGDSGPVEVLAEVGHSGFWWLAKPLHWIGP